MNTFILSPNLAADHRRGLKNETPNQDRQILGLGFLHTNRGPFVSPGDSLESRSQYSEASRLHGTIAGGGCIRPYVEDEDNVICHTCTRAHITHQLTTLMLDAAIITKGYTNCPNIKSDEPRAVFKHCMATVYNKSSRF